MVDVNEQSKGPNGTGGFTPFTVPGVSSAQGLSAPGEKYGVATAYWVHDRFMLGSGFGLGFRPRDEGPVTITALVEPLVSGIQSQHDRIENGR